MSDTHVIFGTGPLGQSVMRELVRRGRPVRVVNRSGTAAVPAGVEVVRADALNPQSARAAVEGAAVVYQCAMPPYEQWVEAFPPLHTGILEAAEHAGAAFIFGDNLYMFGPVDGPISEDLPYGAQSGKPGTRAQLARQTQAAHDQGRVSAAMVRGSDFFGPGVTGSHMGERVFGFLLQGKPASVLWKPDQPHTYTYIEDFGRAMVNVAEAPDSHGRAWHVPAAETLTTEQFISLIGEEMGQPVRINAMSDLMRNLLGVFVPVLREMREVTYQFNQPFVIDGS
ncbi:MAG: NAD-dependent epimerase/dehydratase family protein, partial [Chloroflexi bacterium]|nr:NAD-dependent epimerase/dehydratase family protein [Chloroflexota bacterium]